ncbi:hypothetical protein HDU96_005774 [Phlyctochytrium bullatum]|nr:hypothetical protein HDU96_005774 [Phlyctochytrium bullatum]
MRSLRHDCCRCCSNTSGSHLKNASHSTGMPSVPPLPTAPRGNSVSSFPKALHAFTLLLGFLLLFFVPVTEAASATSAPIMDSTVALDLGIQLVLNATTPLSYLSLDRSKNFDTKISGLELVNRSLAKNEVEGVLIKPCQMSINAARLLLGAKDAIGLVDSFDKLLSCRLDLLANLKLLILPRRAYSFFMPATDFPLGRLPDDQYAILETLTLVSPVSPLNVSLALVQPTQPSSNPGPAAVDWKWAFTIPVVVFTVSMLIAFLVHRIRIREMQRERNEIEHAMAEHLVSLLSNIRGEGRDGPGTYDATNNSAATALFGPPRPLLMAPKDIAKLKTIIYDGDPASLNAQRRDGEKPVGKADTKGEAKDGAGRQGEGERKMTRSPEPGSVAAAAEPADLKDSLPPPPPRLPPPAAKSHPRPSKSLDAVLSTPSKHTPPPPPPLPSHIHPRLAPLARQVSQASLSSTLTTPGPASPSSPSDPSQDDSPVVPAKQLKTTKSQTSLRSFTSDAVTALAMHSMLVSEELRRRRRRERTSSGQTHQQRSKSVGPDTRLRMPSTAEGPAEVPAPPTANAAGLKRSPSVASAATRAAAASAIVFQVFPTEEEVVSEEEEDDGARRASTTAANLARTRSAPEGRPRRVAGARDAKQSDAVTPERVVVGVSGIPATPDPVTVPVPAARFDAGSPSASVGDDDEDDDDDEDEEPPVCSICICAYEKNDVLLPLPFCNHTYHAECVVPWLTQTSATCPLCRAHVLEEATRRRRELRRQRRRLRQLLESGELGGGGPLAGRRFVGAAGQGAQGQGQGFAGAVVEVLNALEEEEERENEERRRRRRERRARREGREPDAAEPASPPPLPASPVAVTVTPPAGPAVEPVGDVGGLMMTTRNPRERIAPPQLTAWFGRRRARGASEERNGVPFASLEEGRSMSVQS